MALKNTTNKKIILMISVILFVTVGVLGIVSKAASSGNFGTLTGGIQKYYYDSDGDGKKEEHITGSAQCKNISSSSRYMCLALKNYAGNVIASNCKVVGAGSSVLISGDVTSHTTVYAHCVIYKSSAPASGTAEEVTLYIR